MAYNSYLVRDGNEIAIIDTVDIHFKDEWLQNIKKKIR
jgi:flavorubredoxin